MTGRAHTPDSSAREPAVIVAGFAAVTFTASWLVLEWRGVEGDTGLFALLLATVAVTSWLFTGFVLRHAELGAVAEVLVTMAACALLLPVTGRFGANPPFAFAWTPVWFTLLVLVPAPIVFPLAYVWARVARVACRRWCDSHALDGIVYDQDDAQMRGFGVGCVAAMVTMSIGVLEVASAASRLLGP